MKAKYHSEDDVHQTGEDTFELRDIFHYFLFPSIPETVYIYSEAYSHWAVLPIKDSVINFDDLEYEDVSDIMNYQSLIQSILEQDLYGI